MSPGRKSSVFTAAQGNYVDSFFPAFEAKVRELDPHFLGSKALSDQKHRIKQWKDATADAILDAPAFADIPKGELREYRGVRSFYHIQSSYLLIAP
jgi:hypothetical protein